MIEKKDLYKNYITTQLGNTRNLDLIRRDYLKYSVFAKYNYIKHFPEDKNIKVLDIGCGLGETLYSIKHFGYMNSSGIDLSTECVEFCRKQGFETEEADALTYIKNYTDTFDILIMNDIIEHLKKDSIIPYLADCYNALKPGGKLIIKTFNATNPILGLDARYYDFTHEIGFTQTSLKQALVAGRFSFENITVFPSNLYVFYYNPLNYIAWFINACINTFFKFYFKLNGRLISSIFSKNIISVSVK